MSVTAAQSLALAVGVGAAVSLLSSRARVPAILPLLAAGLALGPSGVGLIDSSGLGGGLRAMVAVCIGLLVFEGGLHLDRRALGQSPRAVRGLLTIGAFVTWAGASAVAHYAAGLDWPIAVVLGAVFIVTGPTVIQPILRRVRLSPRLHTALSAEAILNDPIGVIATVTTLEVMSVYLSGGMRLEAGEQWWGIAWRFVLPMLGGLGVGAAAGLVAWGIIRGCARFGVVLHGGQMNLFALAGCMIAFGAGEAVAREAGLVAAIVCSIVLANTRFPGTRQVHEFKETLATIFVGMLFVLLASGFDVSKLGGVTWRDAAFVAGLLLLVRPACVFLSARGSALNIREKVYACFMQPRGIVAVSVGVLVARHFGELAAGLEDGAGLVDPARLAADAARVEVLTFMVVGVTVLFAGVLASPVARWLGVAAGRPDGVVIVGAHRLGRDLGENLARAGTRVLLIDTNAERLSQADGSLVGTLSADATDGRELDEGVSTSEYGWCYVWTGNAVVDRVAARWAMERFGSESVFVWPGSPMAGGGEVAQGPAGRALVGVMSKRGLLRVVRELEDGRLVVRAVGAGEAPPEECVVLARVRKGRPLPPEGGGVSSAGAETRIELVARPSADRGDWSERDA
ncbi:MAG: cation:proton antiporter [Phycisphaeraceae bacterium]|nr:cation:proton antiporter [Phycisphaeraceae bacterium]